MKSDATTVAEYLAELPEDRRQAISKVRATIRKALPKGYEETMQYGMISYVVPWKWLPKTYNGQPLALASLGNQKNYMALYLNNVYADPAMYEWFTETFRETGRNLDMGKSCVRFRKLDDLPLDVIAEAVSRSPVAEFVGVYLNSRESGRSER